MRLVEEGIYPGEKRRAKHGADRGENDNALVAPFPEEEFPSGMGSDFVFHG